VGRVDKTSPKSKGVCKGWLTNTTECRTLAGKETTYTFVYRSMMTEIAIFPFFFCFCPVTCCSYITCPNDGYGKERTIWLISYGGIYIDQSVPTATEHPCIVVVLLAI
jgi:hypothetical protein